MRLQLSPLISYSSNLELPMLSQKFRALVSSLHPAHILPQPLLTMEFIASYSLLILHMYPMAQGCTPHALTTVLSLPSTLLLEGSQLDRNTC
jgi:hypothetical protein